MAGKNAHKHPTTLDTYEPEKEVWRAQLLRALVSETEEGSINQIQRLATAHPLALHEFFTQLCTEWMMEDKTYPWYDFVGCTSLFVASAYARVEVCRWLVAHGVDPCVECRFPGMDMHSTTKTLGAADVIGQFARAAPAADVAAIAAVLGERLVLRAPPLPSCSVTSVWHSWTEAVPYTLSKFNEGDQVMCGWKGGSEKYAATVTVAHPLRKDEEASYAVSFDAPEGGGYYRPRLKRGRNGEPDVEILFVFKDGKTVPLVSLEDVKEGALTSRDGSVPVAETRTRRVAFVQLRAKVQLDWTAFWIPSKTYCGDVKHQLRYRSVTQAAAHRREEGHGGSGGGNGGGKGSGGGGGGGEWTNLQLDVPRATLKGLHLGRAYEVQVRVRNNVGWSDLSKPTLVVETPPKRRGPRGVYNPAMAKYGYCKDLVAAGTGAEDATPADWEWLFEKYGEDGPYAG